MTTKHESLAAALAAFQRQLPKIGKGNTAKVTSDKGNYSYKYADLSDVSAAVLPMLAEHGMSFSSKPTLTDDGRFVLAYRLRHESGDDDAGVYPLPANGTPQAIGSAISYARRYVLSAITGVAPDEDDDGQAANQHSSYDRPRAAPPQQRNGTNMPTVPARGDVVPESDPQDEPGDWQPSNATEARKWLNATLQENQWDPTIVANRYKAATGVALGAETDTAKIVAFRESLFAVSDGELRKQPAANGASR